MNEISDERAAVYREMITPPEDFDENELTVWWTQGKCHIDHADLLDLLAAREREQGLRRIAERLYDVVVAEVNHAGTAELLRQAQEMGLDTLTGDKP